jgi:hypothetical protein
LGAAAPGQASDKEAAATAEAHKSSFIPGVEREFVLRADFELLDDDGCSWLSRRFLRGPRTPRPGELVYLLDDGGRGCVGTVERVEGWYICVRPDWSTWTGDHLPGAALQE